MTSTIFTILTGLITIVGFFLSDLFLSLSKSIQIFFYIIVISCAICFVVGLIWKMAKLIYKFKKEHLLPYPTKGHIGVLIVFDCAYNEDKEFFKNSFLYQFNKVLQNEPYFEVVELPSKCKFVKEAKNEIESKKQARILAKHRILLYMKYDLKSEGRIGNKNHHFYFNEILVHKIVDDKMKKFISKQLHDLSVQLRNITFSDEKYIDKMDDYNYALSLTCKYLIGLSLAMYGDFNDANRLFKEIYLSEKNIKSSFNFTIKYVKNCSLELYLGYLVFSLLKITETNNITEYIENIVKIDSIINELKSYESYIETSFLLDYNLVLARHNFILLCKDKKEISRDSINAIRVYNDKINPSHLLKTINDVFLLAIEDAPTSSIVNKLNRIYIKAQETDYNFLKLIEFIESALEYYPTKKKLYIILAQYYRITEQKAFALEYCDKFLSSGYTSIENRSVERLKSLIEDMDVQPSNITSYIKSEETPEIKKDAS